MASPGSRQRREPEHGVLDVPTGDNVRDLGDYPAGSIRTKTHRFLRSGYTSALSDDDVVYLREYGVTRVVDLRSEAECASGPDRLASEPGVLYLNQPLYDHDMRDDALTSAGDVSWMAGGYLKMFANKPAMRAILSFMAPASPDECVLFHCAAGMDRTGVVAAVLLCLCGVDRAHVLADYVYSFVAPDTADAILFEGAPPSGRVDVGTLLDAMGPALDRVTQVYGSMYSYLRSCGVSAYDLYCVKRHLLA